MSRITQLVTRRLVRGARIVGTVSALLVSAQVVQAQTWNGFLSGTNEVPANLSTASGFAAISLSNNTLTVMLNWAGLIGGPLTAGHIHCCAAPGSNAGVAIGFSGLSSLSTGSFTGIFDLTNPSVYNANFRNGAGAGTAAGAQAALIAGLNAGNAYVNLHNATYPGGELRANVTVTPEPGTVALLAFGMAVVGTVGARRRRVA